MSTFTLSYFKHPHDFSFAAFTHKRKSNKDLSKAGALMILYSNPPNGNVTTPLKFFLSLFCCLYGRLKTADLRSSCHSHGTVTPCSLTYWLIPRDVLGQFLKQGLCLLRGAYITSREPPPEHSQAS